ncbi:MAG: hypothetical protein K6B67_09675 [Lachnospiraceae bacterium]|nr:hypothetical protein [Lachnospiraceae bacterium]
MELSTINIGNSSINEKEYFNYKYYTITNANDSILVYDKAELMLLALSWIIRDIQRVICSLDIYLFKF